MTRPTPAMRAAMARAEVGDDVFRDDPTVRLLEEEVAALLGKEAGLFVPSGSMGNIIAAAVQTEPGEAILLDRHSHLVLVEARALMELFGRRYAFLDGDRGRLDPGRVARALRGGDGAAVEFRGSGMGGAEGGTGTGGGAGAPRIALLEVENTHNWGLGSVYPLEQLEAVAAVGRARGLRVHLDGARLWNASVASGVPLRAYAATADTVMVSFSKGLGAPLGSALAGTKALMEEARGVRRVLGGGMRQVGIVAAGALHGVRHHRERLAEDHARARRLAEAIAETPGLTIDPTHIETNIVIAGVEGDPEQVGPYVKGLEAEGVLMIPFGGPGRFRAVTHLDIDDAAIERAIGAVRRAAAALLARA